MIKKRSLLSILNNHVIDYPTPVNINYFWSLGALAFLCLVVQLITGIFLAMHYTPHIDYAFTSVEHIMRDVNNGWLFRYLHANGASSSERNIKVTHPADAALVEYFLKLDLTT